MIEKDFNELKQALLKDSESKEYLKKLVTENISTVIDENHSSTETLAEIANLRNKIIQLEEHNKNFADFYRKGIVPLGLAIAEKYNDDIFSTENIQKYDLTEALAVFGKVLYTERYHGNLTYGLCEDGVLAELLEQFYKELVKFQSKPMNKIKKVIADFRGFLRVEWARFVGKIRLKFSKD